MAEKLFQYYNEELSYLHKQFKFFAKRYPQISSHFSMGTYSIEDPFINQLLESFAFLTARISNKIDEDTQLIAKFALDILYPQHSLATPAMSIIHAISNDQLDKPYIIPKDTTLSAYTPDRTQCVFKTVYPITIWPFFINEIKMFQTDPSKKNSIIKNHQYMRLHLKTNSIVSFASITINKLRFFINAERALSTCFYEYLFTQLSHIEIYCGLKNNPITSVNAEAISFVGFNKAEQSLPLPKNDHHGTNLLAEFFSLPEKFLFFDLNLPKLKYEDNMNCNDLYLFFYFNNSKKDFEATIDKDFLKLSASPIVNLFEKQGEPIVLDHQQTEYQVIPDIHQKQESIEIYSVNGIEINSSDQSEIIHAFPYFNRLYDYEKDSQIMYWQAIKKPRFEIDENHDKDTEYFVVFSESAQRFMSNHQIIAIPQLLCTNRNQALNLDLSPNKTTFEFLDKSSEFVKGFQLLSDITKPKFRHNQLNAFDQLAILSPYHFSYSSSKELLSSIREIMLIYCESKMDYQMVQLGISDLFAKYIYEKHPDLLKNSYCRGIEFTLEIDEKFFPECNILAFGNIVELLFSKACGLNSFAKLVLITKQRGEIFKWESRIGTKESRLTI